MRWSTTSTEPERHSVTIPAGVATVTVTFNLGAGGDAAGPGSIEFAPSVPVAYVGPAWVDSLAPFSARVRAGVGSIVLPANDDVAGNPSNWTYRVTERFGGARAPFYIAVLSADGPVQDYSTLVPIPSSSGTAVVRGPVNVLGIGAVTTVAAGGAATASFTGVYPSQMLNVGLPTGATGATGPYGGTVVTDPAIAAIVNTPTSDTTTALKATYVTVVEAPLSPYRYGYVNDYTVDNTAAIQATIDAAGSSVTPLSFGAEIRWPQGGITAAGLIWRNGVKAVGAGMYATVFQPPVGSTAKAVFMIPNDMINGFVFEDFSVMGSGNVGQHGMWFKTVTGSSGTGVFGSGVLRRINVGDSVNAFSGHGIWFDGGDGAGLDPVQFTVLDQVQVMASSTGKGLVFSGQVGQVLVTNGFACGPGKDTAYTTYGGGSDVYVGGRLDDDGNPITTGSPSAPYAITFVNFSAQSNGVALDFQGGGSMSVVGCHFEEDGVSIHTSEPKVHVSGGNFQNGGHNTAGTGVLLRASDTGRIVAQGGAVIGSVDRHYQGDVVATDFSLGWHVQPITEWVTAQLGIDSSNTIFTGGQHAALVSASATPLRTIVSTLAPGESLYVRAWAGTITLDLGGIAPGDIAGPAASATFPYVVPDGAVVHLVKMDVAGAGSWVIV